MAAFEPGTVFQQALDDMYYVDYTIDGAGNTDVPSPEDFSDWILTTSSDGSMVQQFTPQTPAAASPSKTSPQSFLTSPGPLILTPSSSADRPDQDGDGQDTDFGDYTPSLNFDENLLDDLYNGNSRQSLHYQPMLNMAPESSAGVQLYPNDVQVPCISGDTNDDLAEWTRNPYVESLWSNATDPSAAQHVQFTDGLAVPANSAQDYAIPSSTFARIPSTFPGSWPSESGVMDFPDPRPCDPGIMGFLHPQRSVLGVAGFPVPQPSDPVPVSVYDWEDEALMPQSYDVLDYHWNSHPNYPRSDRDLGQTTHVDAVLVSRNAPKTNVAGWGSQTQHGRALPHQAGQVGDVTVSQPRMSAAGSNQVLEYPTPSTSNPTSRVVTLGREQASRPRLPILRVDPQHTSPRASRLSGPTTSRHIPLAEPSSSSARSESVGSPELPRSELASTAGRSRRGGRRKDMHLDDLAKRKISAMRQRGACWTCALRRDPCEEGDPCPRCIAQSLRSRPNHFGCDRSKLWELVDDFLPSSMTLMHTKQPIIEAMRLNVAEMNSVKIKVHITVGCGPWLQWDLCSFRPCNQDITVQVEYVKNPLTGQCERKLKRSLPLMIPKLDGIDANAFSSYLDLMLSPQHLPSFAWKCFDEEEDDFQRRLLQAICALYQKTLDPEVSTQINAEARQNTANDRTAQKPTPASHPHDHNNLHNGAHHDPPARNHRQRP